MYGYRVGEVPLPKLPDQKEGALINRARSEPLRERMPVAVSVGCHAMAAMPHPDMFHTESARAGCAKRVTAKTPAVDPTVRERFRGFVRNWIKVNLQPLSFDTDLSVETWLDCTNYSAKRKQLLLELSKTFGDIREDPDWVKLKSFIKDEFYSELKYPRTINSRTDRFKTYVGPTFKAIEKVLFSRPEFIKKVPVASRPKYIIDRLFRLGGKYIATDFSSFECSFTDEVMDMCEFELYYYMVQSLPHANRFREILEDVIAGDNVLDFKYFTAIVKATRMSGEMNTSLGNGFTNLMLNLFVCSELGIDVSDAIVVEGDDGLFSVDDWPGTDLHEKLGFTIKLEVHENIEEASFCGLVFDIHDGNNLCDVKDVLATVGWLNQKYRSAKTTKLRGLLRCKALSFAHQYPGCPIVQEMAQAFLRLTKSIDVRHLIMKSCANEYERELASQYIGTPVPYRTVGAGSRLIIEEKYGVTVTEQRKLEDYFRAVTQIEPIPARLTRFFPDLWVEQFRMYVARDDVQAPYVPTLYALPEV